MIPRILHQIWLGSHPLPKYTESWERYAADHQWEYRLWREKEIDEFGLKWRSLYDSTVSLHERSDLARIEILSRFGGFYFDCDMISSGTPLESFIPIDHVHFVGVPEYYPDNTFLSYRDLLRYHPDSPRLGLFICSGWLAASLQSRTIARAMEDMEDYWKVLSGVAIGPNLINAAICEPMFLVPNCFTLYTPAPAYPHLSHVGAYP